MKLIHIVIAGTVSKHFSIRDKIERKYRSFEYRRSIGRFRSIGQRRVGIWRHENIIAAIVRVHIANQRQKLCKAD